MLPTILMATMASRTFVDGRIIDIRFEVFWQAACKVNRSTVDGRLAVSRAPVRLRAVVWLAQVVTDRPSFVMVRLVTVDAALVDWDGWVVVFFI
jgi:hypothetical protein